MFPVSATSLHVGELALVGATSVCIHKYDSYVGTFEFHGMVYPLRAAFSVQCPAHRVRTPSGAELALNIEIVEGRVSALVEVHRWSFSIYDLRNTVEEIAACQLDAVAFTLGLSFVLELADCTKPDGTIVEFGGRYRLDLDVEPIAMSAAEVLKCSGESVYFRFALSDLRKAEQDPVDSRFFCRRAVERIHHHFAGLSADRSVGWGEMQAALRIDESSLRRTGEIAGAVRHGNVGDLTEWLAGDDVEISADELVDLIAFARACVARFGRFLVAPELVAMLPVLSWPTRS